MKERCRPAVKERNLSVPQLLLESASVATAWLTTGTVYMQKTVICGYWNLELDRLQKERRNLNWTGGPKSTLRWTSIEYDKIGKKKKNKIIHRQTSRQMEFITAKKEEKRNNEAELNKMSSEEKRAASKTGQGRERSSRRWQRMRNER